MANWLQTVNRNLGGQRGANFAKAGASLLAGNPLGAVYYGIKGFNTPTQQGWGSAISKTPYNQPIGDIQQFSPQDFSNQIPSLASNLFTPSIPKGDYGTTVQDFSNTFSAPMGSGLQMPQEPGAEQQASASVAPAVATQPKVTPTKMPTSDFDYSSIPAMTIADMNKLKSQIEFSSYLTNPASRQIGYSSIAQRFNPLAGHEAFIRQMDMAKYAGELNPSKSLEDAEFQQEMARKLATMYQ